MEEKNELNDIILNRSSNNNGVKKVMLAVVALAVLLIIVIVVMSSLNSGGTDNLPQAIQTPKTVAPVVEDDPLFEPIAIENSDYPEDNLDNVAKKIKEQSEKEDIYEAEYIEGPTQVEEVVEVAPVRYEKPIAKKAAKKPVAKKIAPKAVVKRPVTKKAVASKKTTKPAVGNYYVQVGSFGKYTPDKKFLNKISINGYAYKVHKMTQNGKQMTKVLVGPYSSDRAARADLKSIRAKIVSGAFLTRI